MSQVKIERVRCGTTGLKTALLQGEDDLVTEMQELGVDNRSFWGSQIVETTPLDNLKEWNRRYTSIMLGDSMSEPVRIGLIKLRVEN
jgi:hypothetical protein